MKKKKVLFVATVDSHIELFHLPYLKMFHDKGYEVHVATDTNKPIEYCDKKICLPIKRSPFKVVANMRAVRELKKVMAREGYEIVHCHTPMGGVVARLAGRKARRNGTRMIYTAHGFHFYTGAPVHYWLMFYPVEWYLAKFTDTLITINDEDYQRAKKKFGRRCYDIQYVPGVGVDPKKFEKKLSVKEKRELRGSLGLGEEDRVLIFPAELSKRKNQMWLIKTLKPLFDENDKLHLLLPGKDSLNGKCQKLVKDLGLEKQVHFLGFRGDVLELLQISDVAISSARQEGLPVNLIEAAMAGLPIVATDCRGNRDVCEAVGGVVVGQGDEGDFVGAVRKMANDMVSKEMISNVFKMGFGKVSRMMDMVYNKPESRCHARSSREKAVKMIKKVRSNILLAKNKAGSKKRNVVIGNKNVTIISNNCFAGVAYEYLGLPYGSPTIGLYFFADDYIKFIYNLKKYLDTELIELDPKDSKYYNELVGLGQDDAVMGRLGDVEIVFLHYGSFEEAKEKWSRRCKRVDFDKIIYKFNDQNLCTERDLLAFHEFGARNKVCFTAKKYDYPEFIQMKKYRKNDFVRDDVFGYHKVFDIVAFINNMKEGSY